MNSNSKGNYTGNLVYGVRELRPNVVVDEAILARFRLRKFCIFVTRFKGRMIIYGKAVRLDEFRDMQLIEPTGNKKKKYGLDEVDTFALQWGYVQPTFHIAVDGDIHFDQIPDMPGTVYTPPPFTAPTTPPPIQKTRRLPFFVELTSDDDEFSENDNNSSEGHQDREIIRKGHTNHNRPRIRIRFRSKSKSKSQRQLFNDKDKDKNNQIGFNATHEEISSFLPVLEF